MSDLLPCPFCGGKADIDYGVPAHDGTHVYCTECEVRTESYKTKADSTWDVNAAIAAWNTRTVQTQIDAAREAALRATLLDLITEQSEGEWDDKTIAKDVEVFLPRILALIRKMPGTK